MQRYFIHFAYDGTRYHGFQRQPHAITIQATMQEALSLLLRHDVEIVGAGRTDAGVHARHMVAHVDLPTPIDGADIAHRLNCLLPQDIAIYSIVPVDSTLHARFSATARTYHYYLHTAKDPFINNYSLEIHYPLDVPAMNAAAELLLTTADFAAFCKSHTDVKTTLCHVTQAQWIAPSDHTLVFTITANRFLRNMVRAIVGTLIDIGRHRLTADDLAAIIASDHRTAASDSMPAKALVLEDIQY